MGNDYEDDFEYIWDILSLSHCFDDIWNNQDLLLCDTVARTYASGDNSDYLMSAIHLNTRYNELYCFNQDALVMIEKYIDDKIAEGFEEYRHAKFFFADRSFDELMAYLK